MKTLTVLTPTFNRAELLRRVYSSMIRQTSDDFVWMIVDDGSTDDTERFVREFIEEGKIEIEYIKKENGGKHTAVNLAISSVKTELIAISLDSDDAFLPDSAERILRVYRETGGAYDGYVFPKGSSDGTPHVKRFDRTLEVDSWQSAVSRGRFEGEAVIVLKRDYAAGFSFPVIPGETFCTEALVWLKMTSPFFWSRDVVCVGDYLDDGYSNNIMKMFASAPRSFMMYNDLRVSLWKNPLMRFKYAAYYDAFSMMCRERGFIGRSSSPALALAALPAGLAFRIIVGLSKQKPIRRT